MSYSTPTYPIFSYPVRFPGIDGPDAGFYITVGFSGTFTLAPRRVLITPYLSALTATGYSQVSGDPDTFAAALDRALEIAFNLPTTSTNTTCPDGGLKTGATVINPTVSFITLGSFPQMRILLSGVPVGRFVNFDFGTLANGAWVFGCTVDNATFSLSNFVFGTFAGPPAGMWQPYNLTVWDERTTVAPMVVSQSRFTPSSYRVIQWGKEQTISAWETGVVEAQRVTNQRRADAAFAVGPSAIPAVPLPEYATCTFQAMTEASRTGGIIRVWMGAGSTNYYDAVLLDVNLLTNFRNGVTDISGRGQKYSVAFEMVIL